MCWVLIFAFYKLMEFFFYGASAIVEVSGIAACDIYAFASEKIWPMVLDGLIIREELISEWTDPYDDWIENYSW